MLILTTYEEILSAGWEKLSISSSYRTWFQTPEAYRFYASLPEEMQPFAVGVVEDSEARTLTGVIVGYTTVEKNALKQFFTRRAIIIGGPLLHQDISIEALTALLNAVHQVNHHPIYTETRNFNDYSSFRAVFEAAGWEYHAHLNFHVDTTTMDTVNANLDKNRKRNIRVSLRDGATIIERPTLSQVRAYYTILQELYATKIKTPLFSWNFFKTLYHCANAHFLLIAYQGEIQGGITCVGMPDTSVYEWFVCGKDGQYKNIYPSALATYAGLKYAAEHNYPRFDLMGAGKPDEAYGVRDFKARFGGKEVENGRFLYINKRRLYCIGKTYMHTLHTIGNTK